MNELEQNIETEDASEEEQAQYEQAAEVAMTALHSGKTAKNTVARVLNAQTPAEGIADAVFVIIRRTEEQMQGLQDSVKIEIAEDLTDEVIDLMLESGRINQSDVTDQLTEDVVKTLYAKYTEDAEQRGKLDKDAIAQDVKQGAGEMGIQMPQGHAAMSNQERETRGLMNV